MLPVHSFIVLAVFVFLLLVLILQGFWLHRRFREVLGTPSMDRFYFVAGKLTLLTTWVLFIVKAVIPRTGYIRVPETLAWFAVALLCLGATMLILGALQLGSSLRTGLPRTATTLVTRGVYRFSRNPVYLGHFMISIASCLYFPDLINVTFTLYGIYLHHHIIQHEERFLQERFGSEWLLYSARVSRYF